MDVPVPYQPCYRQWHFNLLNQTAHLTKEIGLEEDDKIAFLSYNSPEYMATVQGFADAGVTPALINTSMRGLVLKVYLTRTGNRDLFFIFPAGGTMAR